jgi:hemoglobin
MRVMFAAILAVLFALPAPTLAADSLYDRMGQREGLARIASLMIDISLQDERIKDTFSESNIKRVKSMIADQFCQLVGGPCVYKGRDMAKSHAHLKLVARDFDALVENLQLAMDEEGVAFATQNEFLALLAPMHKDIVKH